MWKLTIEDDEGQRTTLELANDEYSIGRAEDASIRLTERNVSRRHAILRADPQLGWTVDDGPSYNGTYVNGERVAAAVPLKSGDVIQLGDYRMELVDQQVAVAPEADNRRGRPDRLVMVIGPSPGFEFPLNAERLMVGRAEEVAVSINHASVSRVHCELVALGQSRWEVIDQGSANGIRINGVDLRRGIIEPGDALELGDVRLRFVAAGKYLRPGADMSQPQPVMMSLEAMAQAVPPPSSVDRKSNVALVASIGAVVAVLVMGGAWFALRPAGGDGAAGASTAMAKSDEEARVLLKTAQGTPAEDVEFAHRMLLRIPADSPLRDSAEFKAIEERWADAMFKKAEAASDVAERSRLLTAISENDAVSSEKRQRAASMVPDKEQPLDLDQGIRPRATATVQSARPIASSAPTAATATTPGLATAAPSAPPPSQFDQASAKGLLLAKLRSGRASQDELNQLKAICMADSDRACRAEAVGALTKLKNK
ncbi:MAG: FHA domain-containing protein [Deltaproteobacteria bacterium]|nr:FHA domain-containing protein [Deltaproteobacteria bacterium]